MFRFLAVLATVLIFAAAVNFAPVQSKSVPVKENISTVQQNILPAHVHTSDCEKTDAEPVQIICILDRSGSMRSLAEDTIGGYNSFLEKQKQLEGTAEVTTVLFDDQYEKISEGVDIQQVSELTSAEYYARGTTALLDAVGKTVMDTAGKMEKDKICPSKRRVLFLIMTDGLENASVEYDKSAVKSMIEQTTENYNWNYIFMGANIDSVSEAEKLGINSKFAADYSHNREGVEKSFEQMDAAASELRESGAVSEDWKD
ncbi:MAG: VWA domain-containing protein [Selenomonadaceae bacterium]|nr:VWA domain-containing protein [Selenomonadaceae bacterium]